MQLSQLADLVNGELCGDGAPEIFRARGLENAERGDISFVTGKNDKGFIAAQKNNPRFNEISALIVESSFPAETFTAEHAGGAAPAIIIVANPAVAFARVSQALAPKIPLPQGIHPTAVVGDNVILGAHVNLGARAVIETGAVIGDNTTIGAGVVIGANVRIGANCLFYPNVVIYYDCVVGDECIFHAGAVIGADGFGFQWDGKEHLKIPQVGNVVIGNKVEVGANSTIDRARFGSTVIGNDCKIDNLVHIAHNCQVGEHCVFAGLVGVSGSVTFGAGVICGGQSGFADHLTIGNNVRVFAKAGVMNNMPDNAICGGQPAQEYREGMRDYHNTRYAAKNFKELEKRVAKLEGADKPA